MHRFAPAGALLASLFWLTAPFAAQSPWTTRVKPYRVMGNIYYVGTEDLSSFLVTGDQGHVLVDTGVEANADAVLDGIKALGFAVKDVKFILTTQAHYDHVGAHARLQKESGAKVLVAAGDAQLVERGGDGDFLFGSKFLFPKVKVDGVVKDGEVVRVGTTALTAHLTPGHTKGATSWTTTVKDSAGASRNVVFLASTSINPGTKLLNNPQYPGIETDYKRTFTIEKSLPCEVFLAAHASAFGGQEKAAAAAAGKGDAAFVDPEGCKTAIERSEKTFLTELERQRVEGGVSK